jgi:hypothetical protein
MGYVRKKFGKVYFFRSWEAFQNGYPHVHAILLFEDHAFDVSYYDEKNNCYRISKEDRDDLRGSYHSFIDVIALYEMGPKLKNYLAKYLLKLCDGPDPENVIKRVHQDGISQHIALLWVYRKQAYALSEGFLVAANDLMSDGVFQTTLDPLEDVEYVWAGVFTAQELGVDGKEWFYYLPAPGPPLPDHVSPGQEVDKNEKHEITAYL